MEFSWKRELYPGNGSENAFAGVNGGTVRLYRLQQVRLCDVGNVNLKPGMASGPYKSNWFKVGFELHRKTRPA